MASHGSDTPTSPRAILHHTDTILCTFMHTTVIHTAVRKQNAKQSRGNLYHLYLVKEFVGNNRPLFSKILQIFPILEEINFQRIST